ncbi:MAG: T9SS type A sorting domain-containing protein [Candidatus Hydrothermia bacterium]
MHLLIFVLANMGPTRQYVDILVYADAQYVGSPSDLMVVKALNYLRDSADLTWNLYFKDPVGFGNALRTGGWNLVIVDHASMPGIGQYWDSLAAWVQAGGALIVSTYDTDGSHTGSTSLWSLMGATPAGDIADLAPLDIWDRVYVFNNPEYPPNQLNFSNDYLDEGDSLSVSMGYLAAAGWGYQYFWNNAGVVSADNRPLCKTVINSFIVQEAGGDDDGDGIPDGAEIYIDEIWHVLWCGGLITEEQGPGPGFALSAYPNPFSGFLQIKTPPGAEVNLWDAEGRQVLSGTSQGILNLETRNLAPGAYVITVKSGNRTTSKILVKK